MYHTILFDLDGTLTDPKVGITKSVQYALAKMGIIEDDLDSLTQFIGPPLFDSFREYYAMDETGAKKAIEYYREYFLPHGIFENEIYAEIPLLLDTLRQVRKSLIVATSKPTIFAEKVLKHFDIFRYFDFVAGSNLDGTRVAKGEVIQYALSEVQLSGKIVMIGDRKHDIIGAKENHINSVGVTYGYGSLEELQNEKPTHIIRDVESLTELLVTGFE